MLIKVALVCAALCCFGAHGAKDEEYREVEISQGRVKGYKAPGTDVFTFYGIPYATAPTGEHKFKAPLAPPSWNGIREAVDERIACPQIVDIPTLNELEDCLIANIFVPDTVQGNLPVLVTVHGGGFLLGHGNDMPLTKLVNSKKVIVVSFNYRVGVIGFLCLGNEQVPGNAGMKDQVALLRWVRDNIAAFGGNPSDVTVSGCSAGGSSATLLMISKLTEGLMHKVIADSGSNIGPMPVQIDPLQNAKDHALRLNFTNVDDIDALTSFYTNTPIELLLPDSSLLYQQDSSFVFTPCVERDVGQEIFLEEAPIDILRNKKSKDLPMFVGFANLEGVFRYPMFYQWKDLMNDKFSDFLPSDLEFQNETEREQVAMTIKEFYFKDKPVSNDTLLSFIDYFSDVLFVQSTLQSVRLEVEAGNERVYLHEYSFTRSDKPVIFGRELEGATHCAQLMAVADEGDESILIEDYKSMKTIMRQLWLDFIVYGNPTPPVRNNTLPTWTPVGLEGSPYYSLGNIVTIGSTPTGNRMQFWDAIYEKHYSIPRAPSSGNISATTKTLIGTVVLMLVVILS